MLWTGSFRFQCLTQEAKERKDGIQSQDKQRGIYEMVSTKGE